MCVSNGQMGLLQGVQVGVNVFYAFDVLHGIDYQFIFSWSIDISVYR